MTSLEPIDMPSVEPADFVCPKCQAPCYEDALECDNCDAVFGPESALKPVARAAGTSDAPDFTHLALGRVAIAIGASLGAFFFG